VEHCMISVKLSLMHMHNKAIDYPSLNLVANLEINMLICQQIQKNIAHDFEGWHQERARMDRPLRTRA
jgi:hypothetical protein